MQREVHERERFHQRLNQSLARLEKREERLALQNPGWVEFMSDMRALPGRVERWLVDNVAAKLVK